MTKDILRNGDVIAGTVLAALGVYVFMESREWPYSAADGPGPGFFPAWYGVAMVVLSLALIVSAVTKGRQSAEYDWAAIGKAVATWLAFAVSAALMAWIGFLVSFALLTFLMITIVFRQPPLKAGIVAVSASAAFYGVFPLALGVQLPAGIFGF